MAVWVMRYLVLFVGGGTRFTPWLGADGGCAWVWTAWTSIPYGRSRHPNMSRRDNNSRHDNMSRADDTIQRDSTTRRDEKQSL